MGEWLQKTQEYNLKKVETYTLYVGTRKISLKEIKKEIDDGHIPKRGNFFYRPLENLFELLGRLKNDLDVVPRQVADA